MHCKAPSYEDFYCWMPADLKDEVFQTEICRSFLFERKRVGDIIYQHIQLGGNMNDDCLQADISQLQSLATALGEEIKRIKSSMYSEQGSE